MTSRQMQLGVRILEFQPPTFMATEKCGERADESDEMGQSMSSAFNSSNPRFTQSLWKLRSTPILLVLMLLAASGLFGCDEADGEVDEIELPIIEEPTESDALLQRSDGEDANKPVVSTRERRVGVIFDHASAVAGHLRPGDRVDLQLTGPGKFLSRNASPEEEGSDEDMVAITILQNVLVLDVEESAQQPERLRVELSLTPNEAEYVVVSRLRGELSLTLRGGDVDMVPGNPRRIAKLGEEIEFVKRRRRERHNTEGIEASPAVDEVDEDSRRLSQILRDGMRATTLVVNALPPGRAALKPGDRIDLIGLIPGEHARAQRALLGDDEEPQDSAISLELLGNVEVLAVDEQPTGGDGHLVTLSATPQEVEVLRLAQSVAEFSVLARVDLADGQASPKAVWSLRSLLEDIDQIVEERRGRHRDGADGHLGTADGELVATLRYDSVSDASARPRAGQWIDILSTLPGDIVATLLQRVAVIDADDDSLGISVTPWEAHLLSLASQAGEFDLSIRADEDTEIVPVRRVRFEDLLLILPEPGGLRTPRPVSRSSPCPPGQQRSDDGDCEAVIEIAR